ncbi:MAG: glycoside hydrolase family 11 protein [Ruminococcus sp.]|uniref:glycoside hydrolase family 11 protein n=1 Tax=Ruminococcus sp. TaxID=41978 RepID=UPI0025E3945A|nr:glycoside hydrolase family 11 protein [Ruminococcus sp.]MCR5600364.1 glycoside hydrolase family 11 protein [Ruminococcus sp.]
MRKWLTKTASALTAGLFMLSASGLASVSPTAQVYAADFNEKESVDGYYYELWNQDYRGELDYKNTENNGFTLSWSGIENAFALKGDAFERNTVYASQIKEYTVVYDEDVDYMDSASYSGIYGWMEDSNAYYEFYIVDSWGSWRPFAGDVLGSFESNGITYDIYKNLRIQMNCFATAPVTYSYYSVARENLAEKTDSVCNIKNTINVVDHFKEWQKLGLNLGFMYDVGFSVQAFRSSGNAKVNSLEITKEITEQNNYGPEFAYTRHEPLPTDEEGRKVFIDFENENEKAGAPFTGTKASYDTDHSFGGKYSMLISGEGNARRAFEYKIDPYDFSGKDLFAGLKLYHNSGRNIKFIFAIADLNSTTGYSRELYSRTVPSGLWTDMEDLKFMLPNDRFANNVIRVFTEEPVDFCVDDFYLAEESDIKDKLAKKEHTVIGDVNRDNAVDIYDVIAVRRLLLTTEDYNVSFYQDVNGDCKLNISDLVALTRFVLGKTDKITVPEKERVYFADNFSETVGSKVFSVQSEEDTAGEVKSAVCSDGTFSSQWSEKKHYEISSYQILKDLDECSLKYSGTVKTEPCAAVGNESNVESAIWAEFKNGSDTLEFLIYDGASEAERLMWLHDPDDMKLVEIGGNEYYVDKNAELPDIMEPQMYIWLYPKENSIKTGEVCTFDGEIDFSEMLKYFGKEDFKPYSVKFSLITNNTKGFVELKELSCTDKSRAE